MLCINNFSTDIYFNLAAEEYLLKNHSEDIFMLWQSDRAVVLGKHQHVKAEVDTNFTTKEGIRIARRYSGGGSVYHDRGNINLTFIKNTNRMDFHQYAQSTVDFLSSVGIHAETDARLGINIDRLKISGSAQCVYKNRMMYHCTLLYSSDLSVLNASLNGRNEPDEGIKEFKYAYHVKSVKSKVTNISNYLKDPPDTNQFKALIFSYFSGQGSGSRSYMLNSADLQAIDLLKVQKYALPEWIWGKKI